MPRSSGPPLRRTLVRALATRRRLADELATLPPRDAAAVDAAYQSLATLAVAKAGVGPARADALDRRIAAHAQAIARARRVLIARRAAVSGARASPPTADDPPRPRPRLPRRPELPRRDRGNPRAIYSAGATARVRSRARGRQPPDRQADSRPNES
ncbi:MAG: hypothetical protein IT379_23000 [Deltaproteobacteria bacterium]|nr:hypothetical protein [Deltaproteobacteria bacterium]